MYFVLLHCRIAVPTTSSILRIKIWRITLEIIWMDFESKFYTDEAYKFLGITSAPSNAKEPSDLTGK